MTNTESRKRAWQDNQTASEVADAISTGNWWDVEGVPKRRHQTDQRPRKCMKVFMDTEGGDSACPDIVPDDEGKDDAGTVSDDDVFRSTAGLTSLKVRGQGVLQFQRLRDVNLNATAAAAVTSIAFHPAIKSLVAVTAPDHKIRIFDIRCEENNLKVSAHLSATACLQSQFTPSGDHLISAGVGRLFYILDVRTGKYQIAKAKSEKDTNLRKFAVAPSGGSVLFACPNGQIDIVSTSTFLSVGGFRVGRNVNGISFDAENQNLVYLYGNGIVSLWDLKMRRMVSQFNDFANIKTTSFTNSNSFVATGSENGYVNLYGKPPTGASWDVDAKPLKVLDNLSTSIDSVALDGEVDCSMLAFASSQKQHSLRVLHLPSLTVYQNFPRPGHVSRPVTSLAFSEDFENLNGTTRLLAVGSDRGRAQLFRFSR